MEIRRPEVLANIAICLIHQTNYLIDQLIRRLEKDFVGKGSLRERMPCAHLNHRGSSKTTMLCYSFNGD